MTGKNKQTIVTKYGQLVITLINKTVNSSHDYRLWWVDRVTSWLAAIPNYDINNILLEEVKEIKDLGVCFDSLLVFNKHICEKIYKAYMMFGIIKTFNLKEILFIFQGIAF